MTSKKRTHLAIYLALVIVHVAPALWMRYPTVFYDEIVYLGFARFFAFKGVLPNLVGGGYGHFGYGLIVAPLMAIGDDPMTQYKMVLIANAFMASTCYFPLYYILTRLHNVRQSVARRVAVVACLYPSYLLFSNFAIAENAFIPLYMWLVAGLLWFCKQPTLPRAGVISTLASMTYATHSRAAVVIVTVLLVMGVETYRGTLRAKYAAVVSTAIMAGVYGVRQVLKVLMSASGGSLPDGQHYTTMLWTAGGLKAAGYAVIGEGAYMLMASFCLIGGGIWIVKSEWRRLAGTTERTILAFMAINITAVFIGAAVFIAPQDIYQRADHLMIGRYCEGVSASLIAWSLLMVERLRYEKELVVKYYSLNITAGIALAVATVVIAPVVKNLSVCSINSLANVATISILKTGDLSRVALLGLLITAAIARAATMVRVNAIVVIGGLFMVNATVTFFVHMRQPLRSPSRVAEALKRIPGPGQVGYDMSTWNAFYYSTYQLAMPHKQFVQFSTANGERPPKGLEVVVAEKEWSDGVGLGYRYVTDEGVFGNALWVESGRVWKALVGRTSFLGVEIGARDSLGIRTRGIYGEEGSLETPFRWTNGDAVMWVPIERNRPPIGVDIKLFAFEPTRGAITVGAERSAPIEVGPGLLALRIGLTKAAATSLLPIRLTTDTFRGEGDPRTLGVQIRSIRLL